MMTGHHIDYFQEVNHSKEFKSVGVCTNPRIWCNMKQNISKDSWYQTRISEKLFGRVCV